MIFAFLPAYCRTATSQDICNGTQSLINAGMYGYSLTYIMLIILQFLYMLYDYIMFIYGKYSMYILHIFQQYYVYIYRINPFIIP